MMRLKADINKNFQVATKYYEAGNLEHAIDICLEILAIRPNHFEAIHLLKMLSNKIDNKDYATKVYYHLGHIFEKKNNTGEAADYYQKALQYDATYIEANNALGIVLKKIAPDSLMFNIIIARRNRTDFLLTSLHYLNLANPDKYHDVEVHISHDDSEPLDYDAFKNLKIFDYFVSKEGKFNKSLLLNNSIHNARKNFDVLTIMDLDMIYDDKFFDKIAYLMTYYDYIKCDGFDLSRDTSENLIKGHDDFSVIKQFSVAPRFGPSQISINKNAYDVLLKTMNRDTLFNEYYEGWGCEDSEISLVLNFLNRKGIIKQAFIYGMWYHLWHDVATELPDFDRELYNNNLKYYHEFTKKIV